MIKSETHRKRGCINLNAEIYQTRGACQPTRPLLHLRAAVPASAPNAKAPPQACVARLSSAAPGGFSPALSLQLSTAALPKPATWQTQAPLIAHHWGREGVASSWPPRPRERERAPSFPPPTSPAERHEAGAERVKNTFDPGKNFIKKFPKNR